MAHDWPSPGLSHVGSYQVAGHPYISGSTALAAGKEAQFKFPYVANKVTVINHSSVGPVRIHFNSVKSGSVVGGLHFVELDSDEDSFTFNIKCKEIYISNGNGSDAANFRVVAELTKIPPERMYALTGSGLTELP